MLIKIVRLGSCEFKKIGETPDLDKILMQVKCVNNRVTHILADDKLRFNFFVKTSKKTYTFETINYL